MTGFSVLTLVRNREGHLHQLVEGLRRSDRVPDELIVVDMSDTPVSIGPTPFPVAIDRFETDGLPLAEARNRAARHARHRHLVFLDVDCIPLSACLGRLDRVLGDEDALLCADIRYLGPDDARTDWTEQGLVTAGERHLARDFPAAGVRRETNPGLFWSLAFAMRAGTFARLGGFDETFRGYGAEDTDFGFRADAARLPLLFVGGAIACHQHHESHDPPIQHLDHIVANARRFHEKWRRWPMDGWLASFATMGLIAWDDDHLEILRHPSHEEIVATRLDRSGGSAVSRAEDQEAAAAVITS
ncbi:glycosyltransferase family 2 protein [Sphingomonas oryzagri]